MDLAAHPLFEFDDAQQAVINPSIHREIPGFPARAVNTWFGDVFRRKFESSRPVYSIPFEHGAHDVYVVNHNGIEVAYIEHLHVPEGCNVRDEPINSGPNIEGTSHHYAPVDHDVAPHPAALAAIDAELTDAGVPHDRGITWTTDAFFRETPAKVARRRDQGCICVEMEASAMFAAAAFRGVTYGQLLYAGDDVSAEEWDHRHWEKQTSARERLLDLAINAVCRL